MRARRQPGPAAAILCAAACLFTPVTAAAEAMPAGDARAQQQAAGELCDEAVGLAESAESIPRHLLAAVAAAESGRPVAAGRSAGPWPWTVTAEGQGRFFATKAEAVEAVAELFAMGVANIDVGCMQINLLHHPDAFVDLDEALDPLANASYGAVFLKALFMDTGSWPEAIGRYHSATRQLNSSYRQRVLGLWNGRRAQPAQDLRNDAAGARRAPATADDLAASVNAAVARSAAARRAGRGAPAPSFSAEAIDELKARLSTLTPP